jgi:hypothetical protein
MAENFPFLQPAADVATIATAVVAVLAYVRYLRSQRSKRVRLEDHLRKEKETGNDQGQRSLMHLVARLGMTETEILDAAFRSRHVLKRVRKDNSGFASKLLLEYSKEKTRGWWK